MTDLIERLRGHGPVVGSKIPRIAAMNAATPPEDMLVMVDAWVLAQAADEIERLRSIRELLIASLVRVTGASDESIREAPLTEALKAANDIERLRERTAELQAQCGYMDSIAELNIHKRGE